MESNDNKNTETINFLCSYGGKILPRYTDSTLRYAEGLTRVAVDRSISFTGLCALPFSDSIFCEFVWFFVNSFGILWIINQIFLFLVVVTELMVKLGEFCGSSVNLRCQLPTGDLETLISITSDDRLRRDGRRSYLRWRRPAIDSQSFLLRPFVRLQVSLSLSLFFSVELRKEFFGILSCFLSLILSIDISLPHQ